ncbi:MAG: GDP-mannose 4,6-dehydratase [Candidatus Aminicenantes bacterium]|nr:GDP-mannose 4,6-dehydratase [Candidatus Aminicenantes bacterium]
MRVLITGCSGFLGGHLADYLWSNYPKVEIHGLIRPGVSPDRFPESLRPLLHFGDLLAPESLSRALEESAPKIIFHLAGVSSVLSSIEQPKQAIQVNLLGTLNLLETVRKSPQSPTIILASSADTYGLVYSNELPLKETAAFRPLSPLAVSKAAQDLLGFQYFKLYKLKIIRVRLFELIGPRQPDCYFVSRLARQVAEVEKKKSPPVIKIPRAESKKDYIDVRDAVRALWLLSEKGEPGEVYNLGSGRAWSKSELIDLIVSLTRARLVIEKEDDPQPRFLEPPILLADISKIAKATSWKPQITLKQSLLDLLNYWRETIK